METPPPRISSCSVADVVAPHPPECTSSYVPHVVINMSNCKLNVSAAPQQTYLEYLAGDHKASEPAGMGCSISDIRDMGAIKLVVLVTPDLMHNYNLITGLKM